MIFGGSSQQIGYSLRQGISITHSPWLRYSGGSLSQALLCIMRPLSFFPAPQPSFLIWTILPFSSWLLSPQYNSALQDRQSDRQTGWLAVVIKVPKTHNVTSYGKNAIVVLIIQRISQERGSDSGLDSCQYQKIDQTFRLPVWFGDQCKYNNGT